jgi:hypothetical protein
MELLKTEMSTTHTNKASALVPVEALVTRS